MDKWKVAFFMLAMVTNAQQYDWKTWLMGLMRSAIQGGAAAVVSGPAAMMIAPTSFNLAGQLGHTLTLMGTMFVAQAFFHLAMFLQTHGAPELVTTKYTETQSTLTQEPGGVAGVSHISTVETTTTKKPQ